MNNFDLTDMLLGIVSVLIALSTFSNSRRKDYRSAGAQEATFHADLKYIKELLQDVRSEMKELTKSIDLHSERITKCEEQMNAAFYRIERIEKQMDIQREE